MAENNNLVKQWAKNMLDDADNAIKAIDSFTNITATLSRARSYMSEVKGCCEAIIAAMGATEDHRCPTCKNWNLKNVDFPCNSCKFRSCNMNDKWEEKL